MPTVKLTGTRTILFTLNMQSQRKNIETLSLPFMCEELQLPSDPSKRAKWLHMLEIDEGYLKSQSRFYSRHFPGGDTKEEPLANVGKRFASSTHV